MSLKSKSAVVTGSTSGIGLAIANALAAEGANVMINGFGDAAEIERLRAKLAADHAVEVLYDGADLSQQDAIERMMGKAIGEFGAVDVLVNNAGIQFVAPIDEFPVAKWNAIPCFAATYADLYGLATSACAEAMLTMRPHFFAFIAGSARRIV